MIHLLLSTISFLALNLTAGFCQSKRPEFVQLFLKDIPFSSDYIAQIISPVDSIGKLSAADFEMEFKSEPEMTRLLTFMKHAQYQMVGLTFVDYPRRGYTLIFKYEK